MRMYMNTVNFTRCITILVPEKFCLTNLIFKDNTKDKTVQTCGVKPQYLDYLWNQNWLLLLGRSHSPFKL